jgi:hypothetical protein
MKITLQTVAFLVLLLVSQSKLLSKNTQINYTKLILEQEVKSFSTPFAAYFLKLASYSYCGLDRNLIQNCCPELITQEGWKLLEADSIVKDNYNFAILKHNTFKKVVVTVPGTRNLQQLLEELRSSGEKGTSYDNTYPTLKVMSYFNTIWKDLKLKLLPALRKTFNSYPDHQYFFTGHSLGAAMATIAALEAVRTNAIKKTATSPVLITYGQPRTGNDVFANEVMKNIPQVYRVVRNGDIIASMGLCSYSLPRLTCKSILNAYKFNSQYSFTKDQIDLASSKYYAWHVAGLKLFDPEMNGFVDCGIEYGENNPLAGCDNKEYINADRHRVYFGVNVPHQCDLKN